jgi:hypothetical protein
MLAPGASSAFFIVFFDRDRNIGDQMAHEE